MDRKQHKILLMKSTSHVMRAEKQLQRAGLPHRLIPVPRHISSQCGICIRIAPEHLEMALSALESAHLRIEGVHGTLDRDE